MYILLKQLIEHEVRSLMGSRQLLLCGGLAGHMMHLWDNPDLTFGDLKEVIAMASQGKLSEVTEKLDGQNMFFTFNVRADQLRLARNTSDIKTGGFDKETIATRWAERPGVSDAFGHAYEVLDISVRSLDTPTLVDIFGETGNIWYSMEVLYTGNPNVINYDVDAIVLHKSGTKYNEAGKPVAEEGHGGFDKLISVVEQMRQRAAAKGWQLQGPLIVQMREIIANKEVFGDVLSKLSTLMAQYGLSDASTIGDYLVAYAEATIPNMLSFNMPEDTLHKLVSVMLELPDKPRSVVYFKSLLGPSQYVEVAKLAKNRTEFYKTAIAPLEAILTEFSVAVLTNTHSLLALHPEKEVSRLKAVVAQAIDQIKSVGNEEKIAAINAQLTKLRSLDNITSSMEGITFKYKGKSYKLTGAFAQINQILGLLRY